MTTAIGKVSALIGEAQALSETGESRFLQQGDSVHENDTLTTGYFGGVEIELTDGSQLALGHAMTLQLDSAYLMLEIPLQPVSDDFLDLELTIDNQTAEQTPLAQADVLDISDVLADTTVSADNLHDYLKATYDPVHDGTRIDIFADGDALDSQATAEETLYVNGDASQLIALLESGQLIIDQS